MQYVRLWAALALLAMLAGCAAPTPAAIAGPPDRFVRRPALIADPEAILASLPPAPAEGDVVGRPAPADPAALAAWAHPAERWRAAAATAARLDGLDAPAARAELQAFDAALSDGLMMAEAARARGRAISDDAVLAELAWRLIARAHPLRADEPLAEAAQAAWAGCWRGEASAPAVVSGRLLGAAVAQAVIAADAQMAPPR